MKMENYLWGFSCFFFLNTVHYCWALRLDDMFGMRRWTLKMTQYKILQNQDFQSCILLLQDKFEFENQYLKT